MIRPLMPGVVKYSALAKNATLRGINAWMMTESKNDKWFEATMNGPSLGMFSRPVMVGLKTSLIARATTGLKKSMLAILDSSPYLHA